MKTVDEPHVAASRIADNGALSKNAQEAATPRTPCTRKEEAEQEDPEEDAEAEEAEEREAEGVDEEEAAKEITANEETEHS